MAFTPEQQRAHSVILGALPKWKQFEYNHENHRCTLDTNFLAFSKRPFHLPPQRDWTWNLSCGKNRFDLSSDPNIEVVMYKMNSRKKRNVVSSPSYKVWLYEFASKGENPYLYAIWCEKGFPAELEGTLSLPATSNDLSLEDFSFLRPFVNNDLANEFGWNQPG